MTPKHTNDGMCPSCELKLAEADPVIADWFRREVKPTWPNAHISWAFRGQQEQAIAIREGRSKLPWPESPHNKVPAMALDLFQLIDGIAHWVPRFFFDVDEMCKTNYCPIKWGGTFAHLSDYDHYELDLTIKKPVALGDPASHINQGDIKS